MLDNLICSNCGVSEGGIKETLKIKEMLGLKKREDLRKIFFEEEFGEGSFWEKNLERKIMEKNLIKLAQSVGQSLDEYQRLLDVCYVSISDEKSENERNSAEDKAKKYKEEVLHVIQVEWDKIRVEALNSKYKKYFKKLL